MVDYKLGKVTKNNGNRCSAYVPEHHEAIVSPEIARGCTSCGIQQQKSAVCRIFVVIRQGSIERLCGYPSELERYQCRKHPQPLPEHLSAGRGGETEQDGRNAVWKEVGYGIAI